MNARAHSVLAKSKKKFSTTLGRQLSWLSRKEAEMQNSKKFRSWVGKNVFAEYKLNATDGSRILNVLYGAHRDCDVTGFIDFVEHRPEVFDLFGDDLAGSLDIVVAWFEKKGVKITTAPFLVGAALYCQLSLMGARSVASGYGGADLIRANKVERARLTRIQEVQEAKDKAAAIEAMNKVAQAVPVVPDDPYADLRASMMDQETPVSWDSDDDC